MRIRIRISSVDIDGNTLSEIKELKKDSCTVGRAGADLIVNDSGVSRRHAMLYQGLRGELRVMDLHSTNGTYLGDEKIIDHPIAAGSIVRVASTAITVLEYEPDRQSFGANLNRNPAAAEEATNPHIFNGGATAEFCKAGAYSGSHSRRITASVPNPLRKIG